MSRYTGQVRDLIEGFNYLYKHDLAYTNFLNGALDGLVERREYNDYVNHLSEECIPQAIDWTRELSLIHLNLLEGNARLKEGNNFPYRGKERF